MVNQTNCAALKISIIVPAFNEERLLGESLAQIKSAANAFAQRGWDFELIVCDNNSTDRTAEIARAAGATVVFEPVNQIARSRNSGAGGFTGASPTVAAAARPLSAVRSVRVVSRTINS